MGETWRPVLGYEGFYEVSDLGRVRSVGRMVIRGPGGKGRAFQPGRVLSTSRNNDRPMVSLSVDGVRKQCRVAPLVLEAFVGPRPPGMECCHNDGDHTNDALTNLRWDTPKGNQADTLRHGKHAQARKTRCPRRHELTGPNLLRQRNGRTCRACSDTHGWARGRGLTTRDPRWIAEANARYREIQTQTGRYAPDRPPTCARGHLRVAPNLVRSKVNTRACLACDNTRAWAYYYGITSDDPRWVAEADRRYAEIMARAA